MLLDFNRFGNRRRIIYETMKNLEETYQGKKIDHMNVLNIEDAVKKLKGKKVAIVTGVTGQDGSHMVDYLLENTDLYIVGGVRRLSVFNHQNISHINNSRFCLVNFDLTDSHIISRLVEKLQPKYFFNFAAQSFVGSSWDFAQQTWEANSTSVLNILEAIRLYAPDCRLYQAGSSEEFGNVEYYPQDEKHPIKPRSPYGASKAAARQLIKVWRESYGLYAIQGWLFNHEGTRRGEEFVTRKITKGVARIKHEHFSQQAVTPIQLGNLDARRDWSDAEDFMDGIWRMMNQEQYDKELKEKFHARDGITAPFEIRKDITWLSENVSEYVLSSNETHTIREFVEEAFHVAGFSKDACCWEGEGLDEKYFFDGYPLVVINPEFFRPAEVELLLGDSTQAREDLGWKPKTNFKDLVKKMVENDIK